MAVKAQSTSAAKECKGNPGERLRSYLTVTTFSANAGSIATYKLRVYLFINCNHNFFLNRNQILEPKPYYLAISKICSLNLNHIVFAMHRYCILTVRLLKTLTLDVKKQNLII